MKSALKDETIGEIETVTEKEEAIIDTIAKMLPFSGPQTITPYTLLLI